MKADQFMKEIRQSPETIDAPSVFRGITAAMEAGLEGKEGGLPMIPSYLYEPSATAARDSDLRIVIDAGGTHFRSALARFGENGEPEIEELERTAMPAADGKTLSADEFYGAIARNIARLAPRGGDIGFCFSYPVETDESGDGRVAALTKELSAPEIVGTLVGESTLKALRVYDGRPRSVVVLNDTVATLLGGMAGKRERYSGCVGYIYGTGTNLCYTEKTERITKIGHKTDGRRMIVNTEIGGFGLFPRGICDEKLLASTDRRDGGILEKATSGRYLADLALLCLREAEARGVFASPVGLSPFALGEMSAFLAGEGTPVGMFSCGEDLEEGRRICALLVERAAKLGAIANAAAAVRCGERGGAPVAIVAEGTTFRRLTGYRSCFESFLRGLLAPYEIAFETIVGEDFNLSGALMATFA